MGIFMNLVSHVFRERHSTSVVVTLPTKLLMAADTLVYLRNEATDEDGEIDRDYIIGLALAQFLQKHLVEKNETKIKAIPPAPPKPPEYTNGRRQARTPVYVDYQSYQRENG